MKRRSFIFNGLSAVLFSHSVQAEAVWQSALIRGRYNGKTYEAGWHIEMKPGWKTYWRVPGAGGVPPTVTATGRNVKTLTMDFPLPSRFHGEDGESIGYKEQVVFPLYVEPMDANQPVEATINTFFGVCEVVCLPVQHTLTASFAPHSMASAELLLLAQWQAKVPKPVTDGPVKRAHLLEDGGKFMLSLELAGDIQDIFVEGPPQLYFAAPTVLSRQLAQIEIRGMRKSDELLQQDLRLTITQKSHGLEQNLLIT